MSTPRELGFSLGALGFPWHTRDPFLFCVHHLDHYPQGNDAMGPAASLAGRNLGMDFEGIDGWRMYHGEVAPGFPAHPHRGFETVTVARRGFIDHSDSLGATARFGQGDVQWMTAGRGIVHSEMFPLLDQDGPNTLELFQIWLNLPRRNKMVEPYFSMLWSDQVPTVVVEDDEGRKTEVVTVAGRFRDTVPPGAPPDSWAGNSANEVAIWTLRLEPGAVVDLPEALHPDVNRSLYFFEGERLSLDGYWLTEHLVCDFDQAKKTRLTNGPAPTEVLILQGRPIGEPVVQRGPFVMNRRDEIMQAMLDYEQTRFGGWPWAGAEPVHPHDAGRFARHADGRVERPASSSA